MNLGKAGYLIMVIVCLNSYGKKGSIVRTMNPQNTEGWYYIEPLWVVSLSFQLPVLVANLVSWNVRLLRAHHHSKS